MIVTTFISLLTVTFVMGATIMPDMTTHQHHHHHHNGSTKEPAENEGFTFHYDPMSHTMVIHSRHSCYVYEMTPQEKLDVHAQHGLRTLEIKMIQQIDSGSGLFVISVNDLDAINPNIASHFCRKSTLLQKITIL